MEIEPQLPDLFASFEKVFTFLSYFVLVTFPLIGFSFIWRKFKRVLEAGGYDSPVEQSKPKPKFESEWDVPVRKSKYPKPSQTVRAGTFVTNENITYFEGEAVNENA